MSDELLVLGMSKEEKLGMLEKYADSMRVSFQKLASLYIFFGDDVFLFLHVLAGDCIMFPTEYQMTEIARFMGRHKVLVVSKPVKKGKTLTEGVVAVQDSQKLLGMEIVLVREVNSERQSEYGSRDGEQPVLDSDHSGGSSEDQSGSGRVDGAFPED